MSDILVRNVEECSTQNINSRLIIHDETNLLICQTNEKLVKDNHMQCFDFTKDRLLALRARPPVAFLRTVVARDQWQLDAPMWRVRMLSCAISYFCL
jgi:hypothetical protein